MRVYLNKNKVMMLKRGDVALQVRVELFGDIVEAVKFFKSSVCFSAGSREVARFLLSGV